MSKITYNLIVDFLRARVAKERRCWQDTCNAPNSVFFCSTFLLTQNFQTRKVHFQLESMGTLILKKCPSDKLLAEPSALLIETWAKNLNTTASETRQFLDQFANFITTDHRRRYEPLSRPQTRFISKAANILEEGLEKGAYPYWNRIFVTGPMLKKSIRVQNVLTQFPEVTTIELRPLDSADFGRYFELPWDEYKLRRIPTFQPPESLVIEYSWCEPPQNYLSTSPHKTLYESIRASEFNHLLMILCPLLGDGDIMARLSDTILASGGPNHIPDSITQDYCPLKKSQIIDFLALLDICGTLSKTSEPSASADWLLIKDALQTLTDSRFTLIGLHSRCALATSCIEGLLCKSEKEIKKEDLATRCSLLLSTIDQSPAIVKNRITEPYKARSKFVHGHRSTAAKIAPSHKLLRSIEGYARRLIIMACHLSYSVRRGNTATKYRKQRLPTILNAASNSKNELSKILHGCNRPKGIDVRPLLLP